MITESWIYDAIIYIYALSLLFYFTDAMSKNYKASRIGSWLLIFVWVLQTVYFVSSMLDRRALPVVSMFDVLFFFAWLLVTLSLVINRFFRIDFIVFITNVIGFAVLALNFFSDTSASSSLMRWGINDELLFIHISLAVSGYAAFSISAIISGMYLFLHRKLKVKQWGTAMRRLPSLEKLEKLANLSVVIGLPLLILSLSLGIVWILLKGNDAFLLFDLKVISSLLLIAAYAGYLLQKHSLRAAGSKLAWWNIASFALICLNFMFSNYVSGFHRWF